MYKRSRVFLLLCLFLILCVFGPAGAEDAYNIQVKLDPSTRMLTGQEKLQWTNRSDSPISAVPLHLYLNAFSNMETTWMMEAEPERGTGDFQRRFPDPWGYNRPISIEQQTPVGARPLSWKPIQPDDGNPNDRTLIQVALAQPVPPGQTLELHIRFEARLPAPIARTGGYQDFFLVGQWFPKIAVLETPGVRHATTARWAARQFHADTEFYADFADYDVTIQVPHGYTVGATGRRAPGSKPGVYRYTQKRVHDFAFTAGRGLVDVVSYYNIRNRPGTVEIHFVCPKSARAHVARLQPVLYRAIDQMAERVAPYPYDTLTVVLPPFRAINTTGMEYPTILTGFTGDKAWDAPLLRDLTYPETVLVHEFSHQYFYGILASDEQEEAYMDEGMTSYWECDLMDAVSGRGRPNGYLLHLPFRWWDVTSHSAEEDVSSINEAFWKSPSSLYAPHTWVTQVYMRPALTMETAARLFGRDTLDRVFAAYYRAFAFLHPDTEDFLEIAGKAGGAEIGAFLREAFTARRIPDFRVQSLESDRWYSPEGLITERGKQVAMTRERRHKEPEAGLDPAARERDGRVLMEISDPGWRRGDESGEGHTLREFRRPSARIHSTEFEPGFYQSRVVLGGPGWQHLPVEVEFVFADGTVLRDSWDGKSAWRGYRFLRKAPLSYAAVDPARKIYLDASPENNSLSLKPDTGFAARWSARLGMFAQWLTMVVASWM